MSAHAVSLPEVRLVIALLRELSSRERRAVVRRVRHVLRALLGLKRVVELGEDVFGDDPKCSGTWELRNAVLQLAQDTLPSSLGATLVPGVTDAVLCVLTGQTAFDLAQGIERRSASFYLTALRRMRLAEHSLRTPT